MCGHKEVFGVSSTIKNVEWVRSLYALETQYRKNIVTVHLAVGSSGVNSYSCLIKMSPEALNLFVEELSRRIRERANANKKLKDTASLNYINYYLFSDRRSLQMFVSCEINAVSIQLVI